MHGLVGPWRDTRQPGKNADAFFRDLVVNIRVGSNCGENQRLADQIWPRRSEGMTAPDGLGRQTSGRITPTHAHASANQLQTLRGLVTASPVTCPIGSRVPVSWAPRFQTTHPIPL